MSNNIKAVAQRLVTLREIENMSQAQMANAIAMPEAE